MSFEDQFRLSSHAVITNDHGHILQLKQTYGDKRWGLPGGALEPGETIHEALFRECLEASAFTMGSSHVCTRLFLGSIWSEQSQDLLDIFY